MSLANQSHALFMTVQNIRACYDKTNWSRMIMDKISERMFCIDNMSFPSYLVPLFQNESKCKTIHIKMSLICMKVSL